MQILELQIKNFGKFTNRTIRLQDGLNILYGRNEAGKSTIHSFIKGMLFGIEKQRGRASKNDEYSQRQPWENPAYFAGVLRFESGGKVFRLERNFYKNEKTAFLVCETDGEELSIENGDLDVLLEGLGEGAFANTFFITQNGGATDEGLALELRNYMSNVQNAGDGEIDVSGALKELDTKRRQVEVEIKKRRVAGEAKGQEIEMKLDFIQQEIGRYQKEEEEGRVRLEKLESELKAAAAGARKAGAKEQAKEQTQGKDWKRYLPPLLMLAAAVVFAVLLEGILYKAAAIVVGVILGCLYLFAGRRNTEPIQEEAQDDRYKEWKQHLDQEKAKQKWHLDRLYAEKKEKQTIQENLKEEWEEIQEEASVTSDQELEINALKLATALIEETSEEIYERWEKRLNNRVSEILRAVTEGRYTSIFLDADLQIRINTPEKLLGIWQVSRGTMEQIYFALRMAVGELLCKEEAFPVILDEAFAMYDEKRLEQALRWLDGCGRQVLLFTCHKRENEILKRIREFI